MIATAIDPSRLNNPHEVPQMFEWMTKSELEERFPNEFVATIDPELDERLGPQAGFVVGHSPDEEAVYAELIRMKPKHCACEYTGQFDDMVFVL